MLQDDIDLIVLVLKQSGALPGCCLNPVPLCINFTLQVKCSLLQLAFLMHDWNFLIMQIKPQRRCSKHKECNAGKAQCERIELKQDQSKNNAYCCDLNQQYGSDCPARRRIVFKYHARPSLFP